MPGSEPGPSAYFITASTYQRRTLFQTDRMALLLVDVFSNYRLQNKYLLHEFVVMPDHFHVLLSPVASLEKAVQLIKGGFSYRAKRELEFSGEIWEKSFYDRRVRDAEEYERIRIYIHQNPVKRGLVKTVGEYPYSSASSRLALDGVPRRLKPINLAS